uniref:Telomere_reg-2 domain-containing protein n=1 Tax=Mesocestoides corti TaxID=53468 RepID=A0A5K3EQI2_MESCO
MYLSILWLAMQSLTEIKSSLDFVEQLPSSLSDPSAVSHLESLIASCNIPSDPLNGQSIFLSKVAAKLFSNTTTWPACYELILFATKAARADIWFEIMVLRLQTKLDAVETRFCISLFTKYFLDFKRLPDFFSTLVDMVKSVPEGSRYSQLVEKTHKLLSLPTIIINLAKGTALPQPFTPDAYYPFIMKQAADIDYPLLSSVLLSQSCFFGFGREVWNVIIQQVCRSQRTSSSWSSALSLTPEKTLEPTLVPLLNQASHPHLVALFLSSTLFSSKQDQIIRLFHRLLLFRTFSTSKIPVNIFGCLQELSTDDLTIRVERDLGLRLLETWSDSTALQRTSSKQRIYLSQALVAWVRAFREKIIHSPSYSTMVSYVLSGVTAHLACNVEEQRVLGMAVGEWLVKEFHIGGEGGEGEGECKSLMLKFAYEENDAVKLVKPLFEPLPPYQSPESSLDENVEALFAEASGLQFTPAEKASDGLDSDDDPDDEDDKFQPLPPYTSPAPSGWPFRARRPRYLRECLDGLAGARHESDELASNEIALSCFAHAEELIYRHKGCAVDEVAVSFADALLHTEPPACPHTDKVNASRHQALVALAVVSPKRTARYLTGQFVQPGLAVNQRHAIIAALTDATCTLGSDFVPVAGDFFFPMIRAADGLLGDGKDVYAHLDDALLARLVGALGTMYACARNSQKLPRMAEGLLALGSHLLTKAHDPAVRRSSLSALGVVLTMTPVVVFAANQQLLFGSNLSEKLLNTFQNDTDPECQNLAGAALSSLRDNILELSGCDLRRLSLTT